MRTDDEVIAASEDALQARYLVPQLLGLIERRGLKDHNDKRQEAPATEPATNKAESA